MGGRGNEYQSTAFLGREKESKSEAKGIGHSRARERGREGDTERRMVRAQ